MGDKTKRPLQISPAYLPYLEKHRIYELFHEIARELVIQQPEDHVMFMKQVLVNAAKSRDVPRTVLLASPRVNSVELAREIAKRTHQIVITTNDLLKTRSRLMATHDSGDWMVRALSVLIRTNNAYRQGWILADCIQEEDQAKIMLKAGILPTHVLHIVPPFYPDFDQLLYCHVPLEFPEYRAKYLALRRIFHETLHEIHVGERDVKETARECVRVLGTRSGLPPLKPRVLVVGPRGSGRKTQAQLLVQKLGLVHVDFEYLLCQTWVSDHDQGARMRECNDEVCLHPELMLQVVNRRLLDQDCLGKGYVLTHYPYTELDFRLLDTLDTPPNRVVFLEIEMNICRERIASRRFNVYSGEKVDLQVDRLERDEADEFVRHPKDAADVVEAELAYYCERYGPIRKYCAGSASFINADQNEMKVHECILAVIARAGAAAPPRAGPLEAGASSLQMTDATDENRCCCLPLPTAVKECYRTLFEGKVRTKPVRQHSSGMIS